MLNHDKFMLEAIEMASQNVDDNGGPFGAVIVKDGEVIGRGANRVTSDLDPTAHAEVMAIRDACSNIQSFDLKGSILYTSCEPCPMCLSAAYWGRIETIYFGNTRKEAAEIGFDDAYIYEQVSLDNDKRDVEMKQICSSDAIKSFEKWNSFASKIEY